MFCIGGFHHARFSARALTNNMSICPPGPVHYPSIARPATIAVSMTPCGHDRPTSPDVDAMPPARYLTRFPHPQRLEGTPARASAGARRPSLTAADNTRHEA